MSKKKSELFRFRKHDSIGAEGAEDDLEFLRACYVNTGDLDAIRDTNNSCSIVVGRTGSGKTALLLHLAELEDHVTLLEPEQLALEYLTNSTILRHLEELGVNLDIFYRLLWRHIFAVELIRMKYNIRTETDQTSFVSRILTRFHGDKRKKEALDYLLDWGKKFWKDTEYRVHEVTEKLENELKASLGANAKIFSSGFDVSSGYTTEDKKEIVHRAQEVVNSVQIRQLSRIIDALAEDVFDDEKERFYVVLDKLDESWVDNQLRYRLIRALIETIKNLRRITNVKILIALRRDLVDRVFRATRDSGFQEEKYQPLFIPITWSSKQLIEIMDLRLKKLIMERYTKQPLTWTALFPRRVDKEPIDKYIVTRTMYRPRDIIQFVNCCLARAVDRTDFSVGLIRAAEADYSAMRFRSLGDEWVADYPTLLKCASLLKKRPASFSVGDITQNDIDDLTCDILSKKRLEEHGRLTAWAKNHFESNITGKDLRNRLIKVFYETGLIGLRLDKGKKVIWSYQGHGTIREAEIRTDMGVVIAPMLRRVLGIRT